MIRERLDHLDGLRGVAAVVVVLFHCMSALTPWLVPDQHPGAAWIAYSPLAVLWNGPFAVSVFFVLSGFVVTNATLRKADPIWIDIVIRYIRLAVPATLSVLLAWLLLKALPGAAADLSGLVASRWLQWTYLAAVPGLNVAAYNGLVGVFTTGGSTFNNVLWTMRPELLGSFACFAVCLFSAPSTRLLAALALATVAMLCSHSEYACFVLGIFLREAWAAGRLPSTAPIPALLLGAMIGSQSGDAAGFLGLDALPSLLTPGHKDGLLYPIGAGLVVYGCLRWAPVVRALSGRSGRFLGAISFPLYLIHVPLIYTVLARGYVWAFPDPFRIAVVLIAWTLALVGLASGAERFIERPFLFRLGQLRGRLRRSSRLRSLFPGSNHDGGLGRTGDAGLLRSEPLQAKA